MSLKLICGPAGSGKTGRAIEAFAAALDRDEKAIFIAPSRPDARHFERRILSGRPVLIGGRVTTFNDLYQEFLSNGDRPGKVLSHAERELLLKAVAAGPGRPETLERSARFDGFITGLSRLIGELEECGIEPAELGKGLKQWAGGDRWRRGLNQDLFRLYEEYRGALAEQEVLDRELADRQAVDSFTGDKGLLAYSTVVIDGFHDFTPLQLRLIPQLAAATELLVTLPCSEGKAAAAAVLRIRESLATLAASVEELEDRGVSGQAPAIDHITANLFEDDTGRMDAGGAVTVLQAAAERGQAELVAAEILRLWRENEAALDDIAVVTRTAGSEIEAIAAAFGEAGIPYELAAPMPLASAPLGRAAVSLIEMAAGSGSREDVLTYLRNVNSGEGLARVDELDRYARLEGIEDPSTLIWEWNRHGGRPLAEVDRLQKAAREGLPALAGALLEVFRDQVSSASAGAPIEAVDLDVASLKCLSYLCEETSAMAVKLEELRARSGREAATTRSAWAIALMRDAIGKASLRLRSGHTRGCVRLLDPHRVLNQRFDVVFVCGLLESRFPALGRENSFLTDSDRAWLRENGHFELPTRETRLDEERFLYHRTLTRARKRVYLCYPYCEQEGKPTVRSLFVDDTLDLFEEGTWNHVEKSIGEVAFSSASAPTAAQAIISIASGAGGSGSPKTGARLLAAARKVSLEERLERCLAAAGPKTMELSEDLIEDLGRTSLFRVTDLERYLKCPFQFFIEKLVRPGSLEPQAQALVRGTVAHTILSDFFKALKKGGVVLSSADDDQVAEARRIMARLCEEEMGALDDDLASQVMKTELTSHLDRLIARERVMRPQFAPHQLEWSFGVCGGTPGGRDDEETMLRLGDISLCGRVDRIDIRGGKSQAIVIDYKTSADANLTPPARFEATGTIQVPLYMLAVREILGLEPVGGEYYGIPGKRRRGFYLKQHADILGISSSETYENGFLEAEEFEGHIETARRQALEAAAGIRAGRFESGPLDEKSCEYCAYGGICREES